MIKLFHTIKQWTKDTKTKLQRTRSKSVLCGAKIVNAVQCHSLLLDHYSFHNLLLSIVICLKGIFQRYKSNYSVRPYETEQICEWSNWSLPAIATGADVKGMSFKIEFYLWISSSLDILYAIRDDFGEILKYFKNIVCLSGISSDGSICWEGREYQCAGLFTENLVFEGNPITRSSSSERFAECLRLTAIMTWRIGFIMDKNYSFSMWLDILIWEYIAAVL